MLIRDGLPSLSTVLLALGGFILCVVLNVLYNRYRARGSARQISGAFGAMSDAEPTPRTAARARVTVWRRSLLAGLERLAQVQLRDHIWLILAVAAGIALLFFALRIQGSY